jgi:hypothetical protein
MRAFGIIILALLSWVALFLAGYMVHEAKDSTPFLWPIVFILIPLAIIAAATRGNPKPSISTVLIRIMSMWVGLILLFWIGTGLVGHLTNVARYRMTVVVETPEGDKVGSVVREVTWSGSAEFDGEAVAVDLGNHGVLFALTDRASGYGISYSALKAFPLRKKPSWAKVTLSPDQYPVLVRFKDLEDPFSREVLYANDHIPEIGIRGDIEEAFGKGVEVKEVSLERTNDNVTRELEKWIPWLPCLSDKPSMVGKVKGDQARFAWNYYLDDGNFYGLKNWREQRKRDINCSSFWNKQEETLVKKYSPPELKKCAANDNNCNPYDTPENRAILKVPDLSPSGRTQNNKK